MKQNPFFSVLITMMCMMLFAACAAKETLPEDTGPSYDPDMYFCTAPGSSSGVLPDGSTAALSVSGENCTSVQLIPAEIISLLGGTVTDDSVSVGPISIEGEEYDFSPDEPASLDFLRNKLGLSVAVYGDFIRIGFSDGVLNADERASARALLGCPGPVLDAIPVTEKETVIDPHVRVSNEILIEQCEALAEAYPELVSVFYPAKSVEERDIPVITLGRGPRVIFYGGAIHASEFITTNVLMNMIDRYAAGYYNGECEEGYISYRELLDSITFYIVPQINPDGVNIAHNGYHATEAYPVWTYSRQGLGYASTYKANIRGVDLNRNFPYKWDPMKENGITWPCTKYFCGYEAASEPETVLMIDLGQSIPWEMFADYHKFGETLYWIDSDSTDHRERYGQVASRMLEDSGFDDAGTENIEGFGGYCSNYMRNVYNRFACTIEICKYYNYNEKAFETLDKRIWRAGLVMGEELLKLEDQAPGLQFFLNGKRILVLSDEADMLSDSGVSVSAFKRILEYCGVDTAIIPAPEDGVPLMTVPEGNLAVMLDDYTGFDGTALLASAGIGCEILDGSAYLFF